MTRSRHLALLTSYTPPAADTRLEVIRRGVWLIALRELGDTAQADDVAQETIARLLAAQARKGHEIDDLAAFARGIMRHVIADTRTARNRGVSLDAVENSPQHAVAGDPLAAAVASEEQQRVNEALRSLPATDRELLRQLYVQGLGPGEIAAASGEPAERVRKRKSRALERLRRAFFGHDSGDGATDVDGGDR